MAFVFKKSRFPDLPDNLQDFNLNHLSYKIKSNKVPFNSTNKRGKIEKKETFDKNSEYLKQFYRMKDNKKKLIYKHFKEIRSKKNTFDKEKKMDLKKDLTLGPGEYNLKSEFDKIKKKRQSVKEKISSLLDSKISKKMIKSHSENRNIFLKKDMNKIVGPSTYYPLNGFIKNAKVGNIAKWKNQMNKTISLKALKDKFFSENDYYNLKNDQPLYKCKKSNFFYHSKKDLNKIEKKPGPGTYNSKSSDIKIINKKSEFQFFKSSQRRFLNFEKNINPICPGMYIKKSLFKNKEYFLGNKSNNKNFGTFKSRFNYYNPKDIVPGPGIYEFSDNIVKKSFNNKIHLFDNSNRFLSKKHYDHFSKQENKMKNMNLRKKTNNLTKMENYKKTKNCIIKDKIVKKKKNEEIRPEPAQYSLETHCINYRTKKKDSKIKRPIKNLRFLEITVNKEEIRKRNKKFGLNAKIKIIENKILEEQDEYKETFKENQYPFLSNKKRFEDFEIDNAKYYSKNPNWNSKTFNVNY